LKKIHPFLWKDAYFFWKKTRPVLWKSASVIQKSTSFLKKKSASVYKKTPSLLKKAHPSYKERIRDACVLIISWPWCSAAALQTALLSAVERLMNEQREAILRKAEVSSLIPNVICDR
jgi:hypothetical protein